MANEKRLLIDKEPIKQFIEDGLNNPDLKKAFGYDAIQILAEIEFAPTVDAVEVVHGRWVDRYGNKYANRCYDCSECKGTALYKPEADELGHWRFVQALSDNCPHCGAKMDGGNEDE